MFFFLPPKQEKRDSSPYKKNKYDSRVGKWHDFKCSESKDCVGKQKHAENFRENVSSIYEMRKDKYGEWEKYNPNEKKD